MAEIYKNPTLHKRGPGVAKITTPEAMLPDTKIPPKAGRVFEDVTVNGVVISEADIMAEAQNHPANSPGEALANAARALAVRQLLLQEAARLKVGQTSGDDTDETMEDQAVRCVVESQVSVPQASLKECERFYELNQQRFRSDSIFEARHILFAVEANDAKAREKASDKARNMAKHLTEEPADFSALAEQHSDCSSGKQGGNLGQLTPGSTVSEFERALMLIEPNEAAPRLVESRYGIHLVVVDRKIEGEVLPFEMARERIAAWLDATAWSKAMQQYISILAGAADIKGVDMDGAQGALLQ